jgi:hypothetical protein
VAFRRIYSWQRFWCPRDERPALTASGYSVDPGTDLPESNVAFQHIQHIPCLVLLGEPGAGKTTWLGKEIAELEIRSREHGDTVFALDLYTSDSFSDLEREILGCDKFIDWIRGSHRLHLFLDSADRLWSRSTTALPRLLRELEKLPVDRLCLRVLCRSAEWPSSVEKKLADLYEEEIGRGRCQVYKLAPLSERDVRDTIEGEGVPDPEGFMREIAARRLVPFAVRPKTLDYLIQARLNNATGPLPNSQVELYETGCRLMCTEPSLDRRDAGLAGDLSDEERLVVSSRIAALSVFCGRHRIYTGPADPHLSAGSLTLEEIAQEHEDVSGRRLDLDNHAVTETLGRQLFSSRGRQFVGWSHDTDAEFLSAKYLCRKDVDLHQIINLIQSPTDPQGRIPRPLKPVVSWMAVMREDVFNEVVHRDPELLLLRDLELQTEAEKHRLRARIVENLLNRLDEGTLNDYNLDEDALRQLENPDLETQLRPYIGDSTKNLVVRRVAISIARANSVSSLQDIVAKVALDAKEDYFVRIPAADTLTALGDSDTKKSLLPLARSEGGDDPDDELKGSALLALWPDHITAEEVFSLLTPPKNPRFFGAYKHFLGSGLVKGINANHLVPALQWVRTLSPRGRADYTLVELADHLMVLALESFDSPEVLEEFAKTAAIRLGRFESLFPKRRKTEDDPLLKNDPKRVLVLDKLVDVALTAEHDWRRCSSYLEPLLKKEDWRLLLARVQEADNGTVRDIYARLLACVTYVPNNDQMETLFPVKSQITELEEALRPRFEAVILDSPDAKEIKEDYYRRERFEKDAQAHAEAVRWTSERVSHWLDNIEAQIGSFMFLIESAFHAEDKSTDLRPYEPSMTASYLFDVSDMPTRLRLVEMARRYILEIDPKNEAEIGTNRTSVEAIAGFSAFFLLVKRASNGLEQLRNEIWARWIPVLLSHDAGGANEDQSKLLKMAYSTIPQDFISSAIMILEVENARSGYPYVIWRLKQMCDDRIAEALVKKLEDNSLTLDSVSLLLELLLNHEIKEAREYAESALKDIPACGQQRGLALICARALFCHAPDVGWSVVWPIVMRDPAFGRNIMESVANGPLSRDERPLTRMAEEQLRELYIWLSREYPPSTDPKPSHFLSGSTRLFMEYWRLRVLKQLCNLCTPEALVALQNIIDLLPDQADELKWEYAILRDRVHSASWRPWEPREFLALVANEDKRLVRSEAQLLNVVMESLKRYQDKLPNRPDLLYGLWDENPKADGDKGKQKSKSTYRPKDEEQLSDAIRGHFEDDIQSRGIIAYREVVIRRGERTDVLVDAIPQGQREPSPRAVRVIVEVKGSWNEKLMSDMESQLVGKYLRANYCRHGVYAVGWFHGCDKWDKEDEKERTRNKQAKLSIEEAQNMLTAQAEEISMTRSVEIRAFVLDTRLRG